MKEGIKYFSIALLSYLLIFNVVTTNAKINKQKEQIKTLASQLENTKDEYLYLEEQNNSYIKDLEGYITYLYCSMEYGNTTARVQYDLNTIFVATEVMVIKINGEDIKLPPMKEIDCR